MSTSGYPLKLPHSVKAAAERLAKVDGVSLIQFISTVERPLWRRRSLRWNTVDAFLAERS